jgi:hypothetical protein
MQRDASRRRTIFSQTKADHKTQTLKSWRVCVFVVKAQRKLFWEFRDRPLFVSIEKPTNAEPGLLRWLPLGSVSKTNLDRIRRFIGLWLRPIVQRHDD